MPPSRSATVNTRLADANTCDDYNNTPLNEAASSGEAEVALCQGVW